MFASIIAALKAIAQNAMDSVGAALLHGFSAIASGFLADERVILVNAKAKFSNSYEAAKTGGASELDAIETAATATLNQFCSDETAEMSKEVSAMVTLLVSSLKSAAGLKATS